MYIFKIAKKNIANNDEKVNNKKLAKPKRSFSKES
jgi:hypothetical protein